MTPADGRWTTARRFLGSAAWGPWSIVLASLGAGGLTLWLYGGAVQLPFYSDDLLQVPWAKATSFAALWSTLGPYGDYRPVHFTIWRLLYVLTGNLHPALLHGLNWVGHATCGVLVGALVTSNQPAAVSQQRLAVNLQAWLAGALFLLFPFAFDAVLWVSSFSYPLTTALTLGALLLALRAWQRGPGWLHLPALVLAALAGFAYEGGVVAGPAVVLAALTLTQPQNGSRITRYGSWAAYLVASVIPFLCISRFSDLPLRFFTGLHPLYGPLMWLQAVAFPVAPLAMAGPRLGLSPLVTLAGLGCLTLLALGSWLDRQGRLRWGFFGLGWAALWSAIPLLTQAFNWYRDPPRVFYPAAVGIAVTWAAALIGAPCEGKRGRLYGAILLRLVLCGAAMVPAFVFLQGRLALYREAGDFLWQIIAAAPQDARPTLFVNVPGRITPPQRFYPLGHEGVIPLPPPTTVGMLVQANRPAEELHREGGELVWGRSQGEILPALPYTLELAGGPLTPDDLRGAEQLWLVEYSREGALSLWQPGFITIPQISEPPLVRFGESIALLSARCYRVTAQRVALELRWQVYNPVVGNPTVFAHLRAGEQLVDQADGDPLGRLYPFAQWHEIEVVNETRFFNAAPAGPVKAVLGVWDPTTGQRWGAADAAGQPLPDQVFPVGGCP